jgi:hypothetical protein
LMEDCPSGNKRECAPGQRARDQLAGEVDGGDVFGVPGPGRSDRASGHARSWNYFI